MNILWFAWKDIRHPAAGGAETVADTMAKLLVGDGHSVIFLSSNFPGGKHKEHINGYSVIRVGRKFTVYLFAAFYYLRHLRAWPNIVIEEINTMPFFTRFYVFKKKKVLIFQLCREIWFHEFVTPLSYVGYFLEPVYMSLLRGMPFITESKSTKRDLLGYGFNKNDVSIFPIGVALPKREDNSVQKFTTFTLLSIGSIRSMKQTDHQIKAFELAKKNIPELRLYISGKPNGTYGAQVLSMIKSSPYANDITYLGYISNVRREELMKKAHCLLVTSVKEGWGLIVTEAGVQGTPSIVYDVDGLRDVVNFGKAGYMTKENTPESLAKSIIYVYKNYRKLDFKKLKQWHSQFTYEKSYATFKKLLFS